MRHIYPPVALLLAALAGCSSSGSGSAVETVTAAPKSTATSTAVYLSVMRNRFGFLHLPDSTWLQLRSGVCQDFTNGADWVSELAGFIKQGGMPARDAGYAIGAIVRTGCPQFMSLLPTP